MRRTVRARYQILLRPMVRTNQAVIIRVVRAVDGAARALEVAGAPVAVEAALRAALAAAAAVDEEAVVRAVADVGEVMVQAKGLVTIFKSPRR